VGATRSQASPMRARGEVFRVGVGVWDGSAEVVLRRS
jgi:hypothetical protein